MKVAAVIKAICWALLALVLGGILFGVLAVRTAFNVWDWTWDNLWWGWSDSAGDDEAYRNYNVIGENYKNGTGSVLSDNVNSIDIEWISGDVTVVYSENTENGQITLTETSNKDLTDKTAMRYNVEDGVLKIRCSKHKNYNNTAFKSLNKALVVEVPKALLDLDIEAVSSNISVKGVTVTSLDLSSVSGALKAENVTAKSVDYETVSGEIRLNGAFGSIDGNSVSGSLNVVNTVFPDEIDVESISGNIYMEIPENDGFRINKSSVSGSINSDFEGQIQNNSMIYKNGGRQFDFETVSGSITVNRLPNME